MHLYTILLENFILPIGDFLMGSCYIKKVKQWRKIAQLSEIEIQTLSDINLKKILDYSLMNIPFYANLRIMPNNDLKKYISQFPIMRKKDIKENLENLLSKNKSKLIANSGSGSSGIQGTVYMNKKEQAITRAIQTLWWEWSGYYIGKKLLQTGMTVKRGFVKKTKDIMFRTYYITAFNLSEERIVQLLQRVEHKKKWHLGGYASSLNVIGEIVNKYNLSISFDAAISWGDKLFDSYKKNIKNALHCNTYETYGCSEGFMVGAKKDLEYFYVMSPHAYVEIVDDEGNPVEDGKMGYVLLTRLDGYSMPLIRYYVGDLAIMLPREEYPLKREMSFPLLKKVIGRDTDVVYTKSKKTLIVHFFTGIFEYVPEIIQFKVVQRSLDNIEIEYIPSDEFSSEILLKVEQIIHDHLEEPFPIIWKKVEQILPSASGKPQIIQSYINDLKK